MIKIVRKYWKYIIFLSGIILIFLFYFSLPDNLFKDPYATTLDDSEGNLLGAVIAADGQWRFPPMNKVPEKLDLCVTEFEDRYFRMHPGFNPGALLRALYQNFKAGEIVSGGSTISMQVIRIYRKNKPRTYFEKLIEIILSVRLELKYTKAEIIAMYISHAPYGSNIVGAEAASWRYFNRKPSDLSWAETALLAVLPNQPGLIFPGRNIRKLKSKRDGLLMKLLSEKRIDSITFHLSVLEPVPSAPAALPSLAPQLLTRAIREGKSGNRLETTLIRGIQFPAMGIVNRHALRFSAMQVYNAAAIIMEVNTGKVIAYIGNTNPQKRGDEDHGNNVDIITSPRSTGSILKPILYAAMADEGTLLPTMLVPDIPTLIDGFAPKNFSKTYDGAVPASEVIARSLNVPSVYLLRDYRYERFHFLMNKLGMTTLTQPPGHYGLSLILGGAEATLWDMAGIYAGLARELNHYFIYPSPMKYLSSELHPPVIYSGGKEENVIAGDRATGLINAGALWMMFNIMTDLNRPEEDASWRYFSSGRRIAWKSGTSFGNRDAWAIGLDHDYLVGVWVGNADGEGRPGMTGIEFAAPLMFDLFNLLPYSGWFEKPGSELQEIKICRRSGFRASMNCEETATTEATLNAMKSPLCNFCKLIFLDPGEKFQVNADCEKITNMIPRKWFVLPPVQEWYYKNHDPFYRSLPQFRNDCLSSDHAIPAMALIYPRNYSKIYVPREISGELGRSVFEVAHRNPAVTIYWHVDSEYIGMTKNIHQMGISSKTGFHTLVLVDEHGETLKINFQIISDN